MSGLGLDRFLEGSHEIEWLIGANRDDDTVRGGSVREGVLLSRGHAGDEGRDKRFDGPHRGLGVAREVRLQPSHVDRGVAVQRCRIEVDRADHPGTGLAGRVVVIHGREVVLLDLDSIVAETIPLDRVNEGFDKMRKGDAARSVIVFDQ